MSNLKIDEYSVEGIGAIPSASTVDLENATGDLLDISGTTSITRLILFSGHERTVRFTGILTLTNGANLVLPGAADITTAVGDFAVFRGYENGVVRCVNYSPPAGTGGGSAALNIGYLNIPINSQSGDYTAVLSDSGKAILETGASKTITIPANASVAYPIGTAITFICTNATGCSIAITSDTMTLANTTTAGTRTLAQNGSATAVKLTSTTWLISGVGLT